MLQRHRYTSYALLTVKCMFADVYWLIICLGEPYSGIEMDQDSASAETSLEEDCKMPGHNTNASLCAWHCRPTVTA